MRRDTADGITPGSDTIAFDFPYADATDSDEERSYLRRAPAESLPTADPYAVDDEDDVPEDPEELAAMAGSLLGIVRVQRTMLDQRATIPQPEEHLSAYLTTGSSTPETSSSFLPTLDGAQYDTELARLVDWVDGYLLATYGREVSANRPWCQRWPEHPEAVARLHSLWLAYGQHVDEEAGPSGMAVWHRDILDPTLAQLRAPDGPFAACGTRAGSETHRLLEPPGPTLSVANAA
ncbi:DUF4913 domain-containing protein [Yinghuangia sp. ASG 101]|uniref:DUF4913 domain-containing protein n=1 Tax=Yinghuangia sp. ASG 101 TaxID=2896848 RepID=UPI001E4F0CA9|nr:DUF4913 domain-containing protein [Yinghuangia sp. ASG 101]UGQ10949.1 DUF4913 domain-containing protein [Yinghuangia sp. ASG 101]